MFTKSAFKGAFSQYTQFSRAFSRQGKRNLPNIHPAEFEPFKFEHERNDLIYGYTMQELYGKKIGFTHSEGVKQEMNKDNIVLVLFLVGNIYLIYKSGVYEREFNQEFKRYLYSDRNFIAGKGHINIVPTQQQNQEEPSGEAEEEEE